MDGSLLRQLLLHFQGFQHQRHHVDLLATYPHHRGNNILVHCCNATSDIAYFSVRLPATAVVASPPTLATKLPLVATL